MLAAIRSLGGTDKQGPAYRSASKGTELEYLEARAFAAFVDEFVAVYESSTCTGLEVF